MASSLTCTIISARVSLMSSLTGGRCSPNPIASDIASSNMSVYSLRIEVTHLLRFGVYARAAFIAPT